MIHLQQMAPRQRGSVVVIQGTEQELQWLRERGVYEGQRVTAMGGGLYLFDHMKAAVRLPERVKIAVELFE